MAISERLGAHRRVELPQGPIHLRERGEGEPILFVHGVFVNGDLWRDVVPDLSTKYRCIAPDWPFGSHGEAMSDDADLSTPGLARMVADLMAALDLQNVTLVGNDTGGAVCQLVIADHRERVGRLVLTPCDAFEVFPPPPFGFLSLLPSIPGAAWGLANTIRFRPVKRLPIGYGWVMTRLAEPEVMSSYTKPLLDPAIRKDSVKMLGGIDKRHTLDAPERFRDFTGPVMLAWAGDDKLFPLSLQDRLGNVLSQARKEVVPGSRTFIPEDRPEALAALIDDFMTTTPLV